MSFLTEPPNQKSSSIADPQSMQRVHSEYNKVHDVISQIGQKVSGVLAKQENEFLGAYRAHMYNVQKELQALRAELVEKESALANNEQMKKLEEECDWYRRESLRLDSILTQSKKHERFMKEKMQMLEDDRNWMASQLKLAKKQNRLLRAEIELQLREGTDANENMFAETAPASSPQTMGSVGGGGLPSVGRPGSGKRMVKSKSSFLQTAGAGAGATATAGSGRNNNKLGASMSTPALSQVSELQKSIKLVKHQRDCEKKANNVLRAQIISTKSGRRDLEEFFLDCINDVKKSIMRRRKKAVGPGGKYSEVQEQLLQTPIELHDFMAKDRVKVVQELLTRDDVLSHLYDRIFPDGGGAGGMMVGSGGGGGGEDLKDLLAVSQQTLEQGFPVPS